MSTLSPKQGIELLSRLRAGPETLTAVDWVALREMADAVLSGRLPTPADGFGLGTRGVASLARQQQRRQRDDAIRAFVAIHFGELDRWAQAKAVIAEFHRFETLVWPRWSDLATCPEIATKNAALFEIFRASRRANGAARPPGTPKQITNII